MENALFKTLWDYTEDPTNDEAKQRALALIRALPDDTEPISDEDGLRELADIWASVPTSKRDEMKRRVILMGELFIEA